MVTPQATTNQSPTSLLPKQTLHTRLMLVHPDDKCQVFKKQSEQVEPHHKHAKPCISTIIGQLNGKDMWTIYVVTNLPSLISPPEIIQKKIWTFYQCS